MADLTAYMRGEPVTLPEKPVLITFDDGYEDNYTQAFPVLKQEGFRAAIFMVQSNFNRKNRLSVQQIQEMEKAGVKLAPIRAAIPNLTKLAASELEKEVEQSRLGVELWRGSPLIILPIPEGFTTWMCWRKQRRAVMPGRLPCCRASTARTKTIPICCGAFLFCYADFRRDIGSPGNNGRCFFAGLFGLSSSTALKRWLHIRRNAKWALVGAAIQGLKQLGFGGLNQFRLGEKLQRGAGGLWQRSACLGVLKKFLGRPFARNGQACRIHSRRCCTAQSVPAN